GEAGAIEQQHRRTGAGEQQRGGGPRRARADDDRIPNQWEPTSATAAPHSVAARLTPSLSSHRHPPVRRTGSWQTVFPRSKRASHAGHRYLPWSVAPSSESTNIPATPAPATSAADPGAVPRGVSTRANQAMTTAPATPPSVPSAVIPPDVPRVTRRPEVRRRGGMGESAPISVAHVSAAAAAIAPAAADHAPNSAATAATPPLASTCRAVRRGPRRSASWERTLPERKNAASSASAPQPRPHVVPAPTAQAATSPPRVSHLTRRAARPVCGGASRETRHALGSAPART